MTPALAHGSEFVCVLTRAVTVPSAARGWSMRWNASAVPQMSAPPALTDQVDPDTVCWPAGSGPPMSEQDQLDGQDTDPPLDPPLARKCVRTWLEVSSPL